MKLFDRVGMVVLWEFFRMNFVFYEVDDVKSKLRFYGVSSLDVRIFMILVEKCFLLKVVLLLVMI